MRAATLGPWEPGVQSRVIQLGFALWESLSTPTRAHVQETVRRSVALNNRIDGTVTLAKRFALDDVIAPFLSAPRYERYQRRLKGAGSAQGLVPRGG